MNSQVQSTSSVSVRATGVRSDETGGKLNEVGNDRMKGGAEALLPQCAGGDAD